MKAAFSILQALLIVIVVLSMLSMTIPWSVKTIGESMDLSEVKAIKPQFDDCSGKILETARTGITNKCIFNIIRGAITGKEEGINYKLISSANICDQHELTKIDEKRYIWQSCSVSGENRIFEMLWYFPSLLRVSGTGVEGSQIRGEMEIAEMSFEDPIEFTTLTLYANFQYQPGESGSVVEISRINYTQHDVNLKIKIY
jgi:hypothetical protein